MNIRQTSDGIFVDQNEYIQSIKPIKLEKLSTELNWAAENTRPDI